MNGSEAEAGPSRHRRPATPPPVRASLDHTSEARRPASPETALAGREERERARDRERGAAQEGGASGKDKDQHPSPGDVTRASGSLARDTADAAPRLDLAKYHTPSLLRLLANLLQQIANANDQIRPELDEYDDEEQPEARGEASIGRDDRQGRSTSIGATSSRTTSRTASRASSRSGSGSTVKRPHPSPTTALFPPGSSTSGTSTFTSTSSASSTTAPRPPSASDPHPISLYSQPANSLFSASKTSLLHPASLLSFHARHVPSISIEAYLLRILKYCPTTNEVFLSLLVYFDRMSKLGTAQGIGGESVDPTGQGKGRGGRGTRGFAIDSFNVHRLVIAGVTVASKFFSDVFYTNSRYAKVGGLPPSELNQLELQFLLLNDFRLAIPIEEMQRYGDRLLVYSESKERIHVDMAVPPAEASSREEASEPARTPTSQSTDDNSAARVAPTVTSEATVIPAPTTSSSPSIPKAGGTAVVKGASEAMEVDEDDGPSKGQEAKATTPVVSTASITQTAPASTRPTHSALSSTRPLRTDQPERVDRADMSLASTSALQWGGGEGIVTGST